jgi:hypothetical protein
MSARRVRVDVRHKEVKVDFECFEGETCTAERDRLRQALLEIGIHSKLKDRVARPGFGLAATEAERATNKSAT